MTPARYGDCMYPRWLITFEVLHHHLSQYLQSVLLICRRKQQDYYDALVVVESGSKWAFLQN